MFGGPTFGGVVRQGVEMRRHPCALCEGGGAPVVPVAGYKLGPRKGRSEGGFDHGIIRVAGLIIKAEGDQKGGAVGQDAVGINPAQASRLARRKGTGLRALGADQQFQRATAIAAGRRLLWAGVSGGEKRIWLSALIGRATGRFWP